MKSFLKTRAVSRPAVSCISAVECPSMSTRWHDLQRSPVAQSISQCACAQPISISGSLYVIRQFLSAARLYQAVQECPIFPLSRSTTVWLCPLQPLGRIVRCTDYPDFFPAMFVPSVLQLVPTLVYGYQNTILTSYAHSSSEPAGHLQLHVTLHNQIGVTLFTYGHRSL